MEERLWPNRWLSHACMCTKMTPFLLSFPFSFKFIRVSLIFVVEMTMQVDLVGGYYDAGDNVKFGFPMAFTTTMLSWSVLEFGGLMKGELQNAREAIRWATDYLLKATAHPDTIYVQVCSLEFLCILQFYAHCWEIPWTGICTLD